ncbi:PAS domain-containing hybrid sensor histidine kinase/response regulator [Leptospira sp. GIMC2001]|uniref:PAS domain-containing hybrid sensor histidine kinase/response regulator n=1 Tax=Leptospira sp. GIMC2001 TaxID=1513297 RepID=UPI00234BC2E3|nr:PAS domain-containing hybrid sensor histidine kinase/response regulator [Leptospira sp. GIMC2001]WCL49907.1 response regulator [Leptospira sp. GIMC2001]
MQPESMSQEAEISQLKKLLQEKDEDTRKSNEFLKNLSLYNRSIVDSNPDPLFVLDDSFRITDANQASENLLDMSRPSFLFLDFCKFFNNSDGLRNYLGRIRIGDETNLFETSFRTKQDKEIPVTIKAQVGTVNQNNSSTMIVTIREMSEIQELIIELAKSEKTTKAILDNTMTSMILLDRDLKISASNKNANLSFVNFQNRVLKTGESITDILPKKFQAPFRSTIEKCFGGDYVIFERRIRDGFGKFRFYLFHLAPVFGKRRIDSIVISGIDITDRKNMEKELAHTKKKAEEANYAKSMFLANMSHEIRTPMNSILGFVDLLDEMPLPDIQREYVRAIRNSGQNLLELINDILDISKLESNKLKLKPTVFNIRNFINELHSLFMPISNKKGIHFKIEISSQVPPFIKLDAQRLRQILINLIGNAIKFTLKGEVSLTIINRNSSSHEDTSNDILDTSLKTSLIFVVSDSGIGISPDQHTIIYDKFSQVGSIASTEGSGLGLSITKQMIEIMNGNIFLESHPNLGSLFSVYIPNVEISYQSNNAEISDAMLPNEFKSKHKNIKVLVVDDNELNRMLVKRFLDQASTETLIATNGQEAIDIALISKPNLILMDMKMPVMDGYTATRILKSNESTKTIPIIALTAHALKEEEEAIRRNGCDGFLSKPLDRNLLFKEMDLLLITR